MDETNPTPVEPVVEPTSPSAPLGTSGSPAIEPSVPNPVSMRNPMVLVGIGAVIIIILGLLFLFTKEKKPSQTPTEETSQTETVAPTEAAPTTSASAGVVIQEQKDLEAIQISDVDTDLQDITQDLTKL